MSTVETNLVQPSTGTNLQLGASGDTVDVPSGATLDVTGATVTGLSAGKVLQVVTWSDTTHATYAAQMSTWTAMPEIAASITPTSTSNKILVQLSLNLVSASYSAFRYTRDGTQILLGSAYSSNTIASTAANPYTPISDRTLTTSYFDEPSTTSAVEYSLDYLTAWSPGGIIYYNRGVDGNTYYNAGTSTIILMEIEG